MHSDYNELPQAFRTEEYLKSANKVNNKSMDKKVFSEEQMERMLKNVSDSMMSRIYSIEREHSLVRSEIKAMMCALVVFGLTLLWLLAPIIWEMLS